jgi:hypothetical protein
MSDREPVDLTKNKPGATFRVDRRYAKYLDATSLELIRDSGRKLARHIRDAIYRQVYTWRPLSSGYAEWKAANDLDPRILIATGEYVRAIKARPTEGGVEVGLPNNVIHASNGVNLRLLGIWLEYGTYKPGTTEWQMHPRPHFRPEVRRWRNSDLPELQAKLKKRIMKSMADDVKESIRSALTVVRPR